ncbi:MAG: hypothetical protein ACRDQ5_23260 [Sciscionella sp.]
MPREDGTWQVLQRGPRRLWDTLEHATATWLTLDRPDRTRLGVTALDTADTQYL